MKKFHPLIPRGEAHHNATLTDEKVRAIRARTAGRIPYRSEPLKCVASDFGVTVTCIENIIKGRRWRHVT